MYNGQKGFSIIDRLSREKLTEIITKSTSISNMMVLLGIRKTGHQLKRLHKKLEKEGFAIKELKIYFLKKKIRQSKIKNNCSILELLSLKQELNWTGRSGLKLKLIESGILKDKCSLCPVTNEWNSKPLMLQIDHIDGNRINNELHNIRLLCPNCHSQTETYSGKNKKNIEYKCQSCQMKKKIGYSGICQDCRKKEVDEYVLQKFGSSDNLVRELSIDTYKNVAKKYNISIGLLRTTIDRIVDINDLKKIKDARGTNRLNYTEIDKIIYTIHFLLKNKYKIEDILMILEISKIDFFKYKEEPDNSKFKTINNYSDKYLKYLNDKHKNYTIIAKILGFSPSVVRKKLIKKLNLKSHVFRYKIDPNKKCLFCNNILKIVDNYSERKFCNKICSDKNKRKIFFMNENEIKRLINLNYNAREISEKLNIPRRTVSDYITMIKKK